MCLNFKVFTKLNRHMGRGTLTRASKKQIAKFWLQLQQGQRSFLLLELRMGSLVTRRLRADAASSVCP